MHSLQAKKENALIFPAILSFGITLLRCFFAVTASIMIITSDQISSISVSMLIFAIVVFDLFDGVLFRQSSLANSTFWKRCRRIIDSAADRFCVQVVCLALLSQNSAFTIFYLLITLKEIANALPCIIEYRNSRRLLEPKMFAKISTASIGFLVISFLLRLSIVSIVFEVVMIITGILSVYQYNKQRDPREACE
jgi:phosphatidylglycerophosphate synthase